MAEVGDSPAPTAYDDRSDIAQPPPVDAVSYVYDGPDDSLDPALERSRVPRASSSLVAERVAPQTAVRVGLVRYIRCSWCAAHGRRSEAAGGRVLGREITIEAGGVRTRPDLFVELPNGQQVFLEVKTGGSAGLTRNQATAFPRIWSQGGVARGANARRLV